MPNFTFAIELVHQMIEQTLQHQKEFAQYFDTSVLSIMGNLEKSEAAKLRKEMSDAAENVVKTRQKMNESNGAAKQSADSNNRSGNLFQMLGKNKGQPEKSNKTTQDVDYAKAKSMEKQFQAAVSKYNMELRKFFFFFFLKKDKRGRGGVMNSCKLHSLEYVYDTLLWLCAFRYNEEYEGWKRDIVNAEYFRIESMVSVFNKLLIKRDQIHNDKKSAVSATVSIFFLLFSFIYIHVHMYTYVDLFCFVRVQLLYNDIVATVEKLNPRQELEKICQLL
ncbi:hypothetical protein RFI_24619, partial [Reticulomyxa filosa]